MAWLFRSDGLPLSTVLREMENLRANFAREFVLSRNLDRNNIQASWSNGVLVLKIPKSPKAVPRKATITGS